jgi:hypothetical protein
MEGAPSWGKNSAPGRVTLRGTRDADGPSRPPIGADESDPNVPADGSAPGRGPSRGMPPLRVVSCDDALDPTVATNAATIQRRPCHIFVSEQLSAHSARDHPFLTSAMQSAFLKKPAKPAKVRRSTSFRDQNQGNRIEASCRCPSRKYATLSMSPGLLDR